MRATKQMRTSQFDTISSLLMAVLLIAACSVAVLFSIWVTGTQVVSIAEPTYPEIRLTSASGSVAELEFEVPSVDEAVNLSEPTLRQMVQQIDSVSLSTIAAGKADAAGEGGSGGSFPGPADRSQPGDDIVPRYLRWHLLFTASGQADYARQLDAMGFELGAFGGDSNGIDVIGQFSGTVTVRQNLQPETERRLYFSWSHPSPLAQYERAFFAKVGLSVSGRQIVKFVPAKLENQLAHLELEYARSNGVTEIARVAKTIFELQPSTDGYRFVVAQQRYRDSQ